MIAVNQDPLGIQGTLAASEGGRNVIVKPLNGGDVAVALYNETDQPAMIGIDPVAAGLPDADRYRVQDLWAHSDEHSTGMLQAEVPTHGTVLDRMGIDVG